METFDRQLFLRQLFCTVAKTFAVGKSTTVQITREFCSEILRLAPRCIHFPRSRRETAEAIKQVFCQCRIPQVIGALDGAHIPIVAPNVDGKADYFSREQRYTVSTQGLVRDVATGSPGSCHCTLYITFYGDEEKMITLKSVKPKEPDQESLQAKPKNFEDVITSSIGEIGKSQVIIMLACKFPFFVGAWSMIMMSFAGTDPDWWLETKTIFTNGTVTKTRKLKTCPEHPNQTVVFDTSIYTVVSEWELICSKDWIPSTMSAVQMVGVLVGAGVAGQVAERIGRKKTVITLVGINIIGILIEGFSVCWEMMMICLFVVGFALGGMLVTLVCFMLEYVGTRWRTIISSLPIWGLGVMMFGVVFKFIPNWRHLCITAALLGLPSFTLLFFIPESSRWLLTHGKFEEIRVILKRLAKWNGRTEPDLSLLDEVIARELDITRSKKKYSYLSLLKFKSTRLKILLCSYMWLFLPKNINKVSKELQKQPSRDVLWKKSSEDLQQIYGRTPMPKFFATFGYYALTLGVGKLSGNITVNMVLMGIGEMMSLVAVWLLSKRFGRKYTTMIFWIGTSASSLTITVAYFVVTESRFKVYMNVFALMSRLSLSAAWYSLGLFNIEAFPTVVRTIAYGFASVWGRIGGIAGTQNNVLSKIAVHLPFTLNGVLAFGCVLACMFLKDTYTAPMEDFIEEDENRQE